MPIMTRSSRVVSVRAEANNAAPTAAKLKKLNFPFTKLVGQDDLKLALCLTIIDPNIGGVLIMGDR